VPPWTAISRDGLLVVEDGPAVSSPKALHATLPARGNVSLVQRDRAFKSWTMAWRAVHVELDLLVKTPAWSDTDREMELVEISLTSDTNAAGAGLFVTKAGIVIMPSKAGEPPINGRAFPFETWTHVTYDIDASHFRVVVGDQVFEATHATSVAGPNAQLVGLFGLSSYSDPICAFDARYDNIVVDFK
jgi:hypothetical protein